MMIPPPSAGDSYAAAAALDRSLRSPPDFGADAGPPPGDGPLRAGPDVVVTLGQGAAPPSTYDASGRMAGAPTLEDLGANAPDSMAYASESGASADTSATPDATSSADAANDASASQDTAVAA